MEAIKSELHGAEAAARAVEANIMKHLTVLKNSVVSSAIFKTLVPQQAIYTPDFTQQGIETRPQLPIWQLGLLFCTVVGTGLIPGTRMRVATTLPVVLTLALSRPFFTGGSPSRDYDGASPFLGLLLAYLDFYIISQLIGEVLIERRAGTGAVTRGKSKGDNLTWVPRLLRSVRLVTTLRGIGWNWKVKNVPANPDSRLSRQDFVTKHLIKVVKSYGWSRVALYVLGACKTLQVQDYTLQNSFYFGILDAAVGWCGACWSYHGLVALYSFFAALTVGVDLCEPWEWPPVVGKLRDAWSVRQMWGVVWHQNLRRRIEIISVPATRLMGFRKGTLGSKYMQLFVGFGVSTLIHRWSSYTSVGHGLGEFNFFMAQPIVIVAEDLVQWGWRRYSGSRKKDRMTQFEMVAGYVWTFYWFSFCLGPFAQEMLEAQNIGSEWTGPSTMVLGSQHAFLALQGDVKSILTTLAAWRV